MDINIWVPGYAHGVNEQVICNGSIYKCIKYHDTDYEPGVAVNYREYWEVITGGTTSTQEAEQNALTDMWDDTAKTLTLEGGTSAPALVVSGGAVATYGAELLTNPDFATNADGWTLGPGAEWSGGNINFYMGALKTVVISHAGNNFVQGDVLSVPAYIRKSPITMTTNSLPSPFVVTVTSTYHFDTVTYAAWHLFDGDDTSTAFASDVAPSVGTPQNIMIVLDAAVLVRCAQLVGHGIGREPKDFKLQGSNGAVSVDVDAGWTDIGTVTNSPALDAGHRLAHEFIDNTTAYSKYRLRCTACNGAQDFMSLMGLELCDVGLGTGTITVGSVGGGGTLSTLSALAVKGKQYAIGKVPVTSATGTGGVLSITAVEAGGTLAQTATVENGQSYRTIITVDSCDSGYLIATGGIGLSTASGFTATQTSGGTATSTSDAIALTWVGYATRNTAVISAMSLKKITQFFGATESFTGSDAVTMFSLLNQPGASDNYLVRGGTKLTEGTHSVAVLDNALATQVGGVHNIAIGSHAFDTNTWQDGCTGVGGYAGAGCTGREITAIGYLAGCGTGAQDYSTFVGCAAGWEGTLTSSIVIGIHTGYHCTGTNNIFLCNSDGTTWAHVSDCLVISPLAGPNYFIYGIHDNSGTTGYLNLRGDFNPSTADTYELGADGTEWNKAWVNEVKAVTKFGLALAPIAPRAHVADAAGGTEVATINSILATLEAFGFHLAS
jgi:hypothetical protein